MLRRSRGGWECGYADAVFHLNHMVGLQHLARLVATPGEIHVLDLAAPGTSESTKVAAAPAVLDTKVKAAYRERITDLRDDLEEAEPTTTWSAPTGCASNSTRSLTNAEARSVSAAAIGPRPRLPSGLASRVRKAITAVLHRLAQHDSSSGQHVRIHIKTGL